MGEAEGAAVARAMEEGSFDVEVADSAGQVVMALQGYRTAALPGTDVLTTVAITVYARSSIPATPTSRASRSK